jgi:hypothetical protein
MRVGHRSISFSLVPEIATPYPSNELDVRHHGQRLRCQRDMPQSTHRRIIGCYDVAPATSASHPDRR